MSGRQCSTCKHYDPAPILRKGWCRNPILYAPQQSHLVGEDDLDCERGMGNYWEPADSVRETQIANAFEVLDRPVAPLQLFDASGAPYTSQAGRPVYPVSGSSDYRDDPMMDDPDDPGRQPPTRSGERQLEYYSEERYWTDYLRIILPILGVLIFLVLLYLWALAFLRDDEDPPGQTGAAATVTLPVITADATDTPRVGATGTPRIVVTAPPIQPTPPGQTPAEPTPTDEPADTPIEPAGEIFVGGQIRVANTAGEGANMRSEPTTDAGVIAVVLDGTVMDVIGGPEEALGFTWWNVSGDQGEGWIVENYLVATD
jgi:hypothetical protein